MHWAACDAFSQLSSFTTFSSIDQEEQLFNLHALHVGKYRLSGDTGNRVKAQVIYCGWPDRGNAGGEAGGTVTL
jgi:hypothetical protein